MSNKFISAADLASVLKIASRRRKPWRTFMSAVILAGGVGSRAATGDGLSKQLRPIAGIPMIVRTIAAFENSDWVDEIIIVAHPDELRLYAPFKGKYGFSKITAVVSGGETRQSSALAGFKAIDDFATLVCFHDGARPLVTDEIIASVAHLARTRGGAAAAFKATDSLKYADATGKVDPEKPLDREHIFHVQTPQIFRVQLYRTAAYVALDTGFLGTDDCSLLENIGFSSRLVDCGAAGRENIKVTTPSDFYIAEAILAARGKMQNEK